MMKTLWILALGACTLGGNSGDDVAGDPEPRLVSFRAPSETLARVGSSYTFTDVVIANDGDAPLPRSVDVSVGIAHSSRDGVYCYDASSLYVLPGGCSGLAAGDTCTIPSLSARILDPMRDDCLGVPRGSGFSWAIKVDATNVVELEYNEDDNFQRAGSITVQ